MPGKQHGHSRTKTYQVWASMHARCRNPKKREWKDYGGRGITVCKEWASFLAFLADMGERRPDRTLDRIDNNSGYCKANCRWATVYEQRRNTRYTRIITVLGFTGCMADVATHFNMRKGLLHARLRRGWPVEQAVTQPPDTVKVRACHIRWGH